MQLLSKTILKLIVIAYQRSKQVQYINLLFKYLLFKNCSCLKNVKLFIFYLQNRKLNTNKLLLTNFFFKNNYSLTHITS